jgi:preprotein translocase subunit SecA
MNPYKVLQLEQGADKQAVKKAYFKLIRQYPPEKFPEKFKEIREAYEFLQDEVNIAQMQKSIQLPEEFVKPYYQVLEWMKAKEYEKAAGLCERVLSIVELQEFRILLGKAYSRNGNPGKAIKLWEGVCNKDKDNAEYLEQLGEAYKDRGWNKKALNVYYTLYKRKAESLSVYDGLIDIAMEQGADDLVREAGEGVLVYYIQIEKHTREDAECMDNILYMISEYMLESDCKWLLSHADSMLDIMSEVPIEFKVYENTLLHNYNDLIDIWENDEAAQPIIERYHDYIDTNEKSFSIDQHYQLLFVRCQMEQIKLSRDTLIHDIIKEIADFWYGRKANEESAAVKASAELRRMQMEMSEHYKESMVYDTLLFMVNQLDRLNPSLKRIKEEYPLLGQAMGEYLNEMLDCTSQSALFRTYEKKYKKLMGYPSGARLSLQSKEEEVYDTDENGTYRREGAKIGRNDPCPCGSGRKYKQCCGK